MNNHSHPFRDYGHWIREKMNGRVQKIAVDAGFTCPNRDGKLSYGGCVFCDNRTFNPSYCHPQHSITQQINEGKEFFGRKYPDMKYLAYFQAFTNTYAPLDLLKKRYEEALECDDVVGIVIGTRPDCISAQILNYLEELSQHTFVIVEYGIESTNDHLLKWMNRGHNFECSKKAIEETAGRGIVTGGHVIIGLPGDDDDTLCRQAETLSSLPLHILKVHQLQVIKNTRLAQLYASQPFTLFTVDEYIETIGRYIQHLRPDIILERFVSQSPKDMLVAPHWGLKNHEFTDRLVNYLKKNGIYQGKALSAVSPTSVEEK